LPVVLVLPAHLVVEAAGAVAAVRVGSVPKAPVPLLPVRSRLPVNPDRLQGAGRERRNSDAA